MFSAPEGEFAEAVAGGFGGFWDCGLVSFCLAKHDQLAKHEKSAKFANRLAFLVIAQCPSVSARIVTKYSRREKKTKVPSFQKKPE